MILPYITDTAIKIFICGLVCHLFADWILQNAWMSDNKSSLLHPASWIHSGIHLLGLLFIFPEWWMAVLIFITHILIDTRVPLIWWRRIYRQTTTGDAAMHVGMWGDQVLHISILAIAALIAGGLR